MSLESIGVPVRNVAVAIVNAIFSIIANLTFFILISLLTVSFLSGELTTIKWMSILYPIMTGTALLVTIVMLLYYITVRRIALVLVSTLYFASDFVILLLSLLSTGAEPKVSIDTCLQLIAVTRNVQWLFLVGIVHYGGKLILPDIRHVFGMLRARKITKP